MELQEILRRRRMVRSYRDEPVPREAIERIVATIRRAPSGGYSQGQRVIVVTDPDTRRRLAEIASEHAYAEPWISRAPVHLVVLTREQDYHERYRQPDKLKDGGEIAWPAPYWHVDAGALLMLLLLAAIDEGLAAGVYGLEAENLPAFKAVLGVPADVHFVAVVTVGYAGEADPVSDGSSRRTRARKPLTDLVRWEGW